MFSALKHKGRPLYELARKGIDIERQARDIVISTLNLEKFDGSHFSLTVVCSKGTYIRNLVEDIGDSLGVNAHVTRLHRVYTAGFQNMSMYTLDELEAMSMEKKQACLIPMDKAVDYLNSLILLEEEIVLLRQGKIIERKNPVDLAGLVRLYDPKMQFIGLGECQINGDLKAQRLLAF